MSFLTFVIKDLLKKKIRFSLTVLSVVVGIAACIIMLGLSEGIKGTLETAYQDRDIDIVVFEEDQFNIISSRIDASLIHKLSSMPEIKSASGVLLDFIRYDDTILPLYGWPVDSPLFQKIDISGKPPSPQANELIIGNIFSKFSEKKTGDTITIKNTPFTIVGVFNSNVPFEKSAWIIPLSTMHRLDPDYNGKLLGINIELKSQHRDLKSIKSIIERIEYSLPGVTAQSADTFAAEKTQQILMGEKIAFLVVAITVTAIILGLVNTMITSIYERRKLLGLLMVLGWEKAEILKSLLLQTLILCILGGAGGMLIGFFATGYIFNMILINIFTPTWSYAFVLKITVVVLATAGLSAILPSWVILHLNPVEVMKNE